MRATKTPTKTAVKEQSDDVYIETNVAYATLNRLDTITEKTNS